MYNKLFPETRFTTPESFSVFFSKYRAENLGLGVRSIINQLNEKKMKKGNFSLEKFASHNVKTLDANELNLIVGSYKTVSMCSISYDTDPGHPLCSVTHDTDPIKVATGTGA